MLTSVLHLGFPATGDRTVSKSLSDLGLNYLRAAPSAFRYEVHCRETQLAYEAYIKAFPEAISATHRNEAVMIRNDFLPLPPIPENLNLPIPPVTVGVAFKKALSEATERSIIEEHKMERIEFNKKLLYIHPQPSTALLNYISDLQPNEVCAVPVNVVNLKSMRFLKLSVRILSWLLIIHRYPAFSTDEERFDIPVDLTANSNTEEQDDDIDSGTIYIVEPGTRKRRRVDNESEDTILVDRPARYIVLSRMKPTPLAESHPFSVTIGDVPNFPGIVVPFVRDMAVHDKDMVISVISTYAFRSLGNTMNAANGKMIELRSAWGNICATECGIVLSHIAKCFDIAIQCQCICTPIFHEGIYQCSVISGAKYAIAAYNVIYQPSPPDQIAELVRRNSTHVYSLGAIAEVLEGNFDDVKTMRELRGILLNMGLTEAQRGRVQQLLPGLNFGETFWAFNFDRVFDALYLLSEAVDIKNDVPLHYSAFFLHDRESLVLSAFGYQSFTLNIPSNPIFDVGVNNIPRTFVFRIVSLEQAVMDMRHIKSSKKFSNNPRNLSTSYQDRKFAEDQKGMIWKLMKKYAFFHETISSESANAEVQEEEFDVSLGFE